MPSKISEKDTKAFLSDAKFYESYSRFIPEQNRYEDWDDAVTRVMSMHRDYYKEKMNPELQSYIDFAENAYKEKRILGAQRALQFGGEQLLKHQGRLYNCLAKETEFLTDKGSRKFTDLADGEQVTVLNHTGKWVTADVKSYGIQKLNKITLKRKRRTQEVWATQNHRWYLASGDITDSLQIGDRILKAPETFKPFDWNSATDFEKLYWCYGMVFGDGTVNTSGHSKIRLCGNDKNYEERFLEMGFSSSSSLSIKGDIIISCGSYKKTLPDLNKDSISLIHAFICGLLDADGEKSDTTGYYKSIQQTTSKEIHDFIRRTFPLVGLYISKEYDYSEQITNFGPRGDENRSTIRYILTTSPNSGFDAGWTVDNIEEDLREEEVWCLEVEGEDKSFVLSSGVVTGNCTSTVVDRVEFFGEIFYWLLCGAGAGFAVYKKYVDKLPNVMPRLKQPKLHTIEDSIEGWATSLDVLMSSFFAGGGKHPEYSGRKVYFDFTQIRPKGAMISGGFKAPGPEPLRAALNKIENILISASEQKRILRPIEVYDIVMHAADAVLAGGVRRSATICLFDIDDIEMMEAKTGTWYIDNPQRARSNNSVAIIKNKATKEQFMEIYKRTQQFGEPGFVFVENDTTTYNPCVEVGMHPFYYETPKAEPQSGWQGCNLTEVNGSMCDTEENFYIACKAAAILGTLQAGYTMFKFLTDVTRKIFEREALLGVSITGWMNSPEILFDEKILKKGAKIVKETNAKIAKLLGINPAARTTCVKPSGNASVLLQTSSGIHGEHSEKYFRIVQMNKNTDIAEMIKDTNPDMIEESVWSENKTDYAIFFPVIAKKGSVFKSSLIGKDLLEYVKKAQRYWVDEGTNVDLCVDPTVRHNVSNTVQVDNWDDVGEYIWENRKFFAGISLLGMSGDKDFNQAPNTEVLTPEKIVRKYGGHSMFASGLIVDGLKAFNNNLWIAISTAQGVGEDLSLEDHNTVLKNDWVRRFKKFSENFFDGDLKETEYCLKDVHLAHKWVKIQKNMKEISFNANSISNKEVLDINTMGAQACAGGACEVVF